MDARRHRDVAQVPTPALFSCFGNRYGRPFCRPEDRDHPDGADYWVQAEGADVDRQALWRFRRRFCERNFVHRPGNANSFCHFRQPVAVTICDMSGADTVQPVARRANDVCSIRRDPDADEHVANGGGQTGKLPR